MVGSRRPLKTLSHEMKSTVDFTDSPFKTPSVALAKDWAAAIGAATGHVNETIARKNRVISNFVRNKNSDSIIIKTGSFACL